jgi:hypothetical protein
MPTFPTSTTVLDSILFRDAFGTSRMREVFSDFSLISRYAEVEIALAKAEARCGVIPAEAAEEIAKRTDVSAFDFDLLRARPISSAIRSCPWSTRWQNNAATPDVTCIGARPRRTSWIPPSSCRCAMG